MSTTIQNDNFRESNKEKKQRTRRANEATSKITHFGRTKSIYNKKKH